MSQLNKLKKLDIGQTEVKRTVKIGTKTLLMTLRETTDTINIYIGGHDLYCLNIFILKENSIYSRMRDTSIAHLPGIDFNRECSLEYNFNRGLDTTMLLKFSITYIQKTYPHVRGISFNDASYRTCDNGQNVSLAMMSYITSGQTWYEKHFGAYLDAKSKVKFIPVEKEFIESKKTFTWEMMNTLIESEFPIEKEKVKELFDSAGTWQEFFGPLKEKLGISEFCIFIAPWIPKFIQLTMDDTILGLHYILPIQDYGIVYSISDYQRGGKRFTRAIKKKRGDYR